MCVHDPAMMLSWECSGEEAEGLSALHAVSLICLFECELAAPKFVGWPLRWDGYQGMKFSGSHVGSRMVRYQGQQY